MSDGASNANSADITRSGQTAAESSVVQEKKALRTQLRRRRRERREEQDASAQIAESRAYEAHGMNCEALTNARCIASFEPMRTEPDISRLNSALLQKARIIYPITLENLDLSWRDAETGTDLGLFGISQADCIIAPGLAVDENGYRIGQGGGCYDGALPRRRPGTPVIMTAFDDETGQPVPVEPHDQPVDAVLTPSGIHWFSERPRPM